jgi:hypothetical protein
MKCKVKKQWAIKGTVSLAGLGFWWHTWIDLGQNKRRAWLIFLIFFMSFRIFRAILIFLPVNASLCWLNYVSCLFLSMNWRCSNTVGTVGFFKDWTEVPHSLCKCRHWSIALGFSDYYWTTVNTTWGTVCLIQDFTEFAEHTPTFFTWYQYYADLEL